MQLNQQLTTLEKEIADKQAELLKLQQSIQAETAKLAQVTRSARCAGAASGGVRRRHQEASSLRHTSWTGRGCSCIARRSTTRPLQKFQAAVALRPGDPVLLNNLGFLYYVDGPL